MNKPIFQPTSRTNGTQRPGPEKTLQTPRRNRRARRQPYPHRIQLATSVLVPEKQKPHEERRACTYATLLQLSSLLGSNVNRVKQHRSLGEEELNRIDMHHLSQSALVTLLASDWTTLQCNYMPMLKDCKPKIVIKERGKKLYKPSDVFDASTPAHTPQRLPLVPDGDKSLSPPGPP